MSVLRRDAVRVVVPASSANLGPGFDTAGLALAIYDEAVAMVTDDPGVLIEIAGEGVDSVPRDESHLVARAMAAAFGWLGVRPSGFVLRCSNAIPHGRGLGSSAAAIIGGITLGRALVDDGPQRMTDSDVLQVALTFEPHPDNLAAALYGGFTVAWLENDGFADAVRREVHPDVEPVLLIPPDEVLTTRARAMLPSTVPFADAAFNIARAALLVHAVTEEPRLLMAATDDRLHQAARATAYPRSVDMVAALRDIGIPAVISGAGPTVLAFAGVPSDGVVRELAEGEWQVCRVAVASGGARELPMPPIV